MTVDSLSLVTTHYRPQEKLLVPCWATSAAAAQAARIAARVWAEHPRRWPETIRALLVHSAAWTPRMLEHFAGARGNKTATEALVRRYGFGAPQLHRALRSATNALTLIVEDSIHPFADGKMRELHLHELPWPVEALQDLFDTQVQLRVTLSYFVEPNPGRRGWKTRYQYASHHLRFELRRAGESLDEFRKRVNASARDEDERRPKAPADPSWLLGSNRYRGSLHSDIWTGPAIDLAARNHLAIFPVSGWWKYQQQRDRSHLGARYALIVSIETEAEDVDIWTPVAQQVGITVTT